MVMLDIETMGLRQDSYIWEIGAILFKGYPSFEVLSDKVWHLNLDDQKHRDFNPKTLVWTHELANGPERTKALAYAATTGLNVRSWVLDYQAWLERHDVQDPCVWTWGTHFDISMLESLIQSKDSDLRAPWSYKKPMDLRTLDRLFSFMNPGAPEKDKDQVPHDALGDCRLQLERLKLLFEFFGERILDEC